jgi:hypothetical protein
MAPNGNVLKPVFIEPAPPFQVKMYGKIQVKMYAYGKIQVKIYGKMIANNKLHWVCIWKMGGQVKDMHKFKGEGHRTVLVK